MPALELGVSRLSSVVFIGLRGRRIFSGLTSGLGARLSELAAEETRPPWELLIEGRLSPREVRSGVLQEGRSISGVTLVERPEAEGMRRPFKPTVSVVFCRVRRRAPGFMREDAACMACVSRSACESSRCSSHTCVPSILHWRRSAVASASALSTRCCSAAALPRSLCCFVRGIAAHPLDR